MYVYPGDPAAERWTKYIFHVEMHSNPGANVAKLFLPPLDPGGLKDYVHCGINLLITEESLMVSYLLVSASCVTTMKWKAC
jgi:hypothetical protein